MRLTWTQFMARCKEFEPLREFRGLEVGLWLQAEQRHRNDTLVPKGYARRQEWAKDRAASHEAVRRDYMSRLEYKEVLRGANYGRGFETRTLNASPASWKPKGELFVMSGKPVDLGLLEQRGLDKIKEMKFEGNKPVLYLDPEADEAIVKG